MPRRRPKRLLAGPMDTGAVHGAARHRAGIFPWLQVAEAIASGHLRELPITDQQPLVRDSALIHC